MKRLTTIALSSILLLSLAACTYTTGEGQIVEKVLDVSSFNGIEMDGSFDVSIEQGAAQKVVAVGHENIIEKLQLSVLDDVLYISLEEGNYINYELEVRLTMPELTSASLDGSGDIRIGTFVNQNKLEIALDGSGDIETTNKSVLEYTEMNVELEGSGDIDLQVKTEELVAVIDGSGDVELEGVTDSFEAKLNGSGDIKAYKLEAINVLATLDGSGSIQVNAKKHLDASLNGSGDITYEGEPQVEASIDGSGSIKSK